MVIVCFYNEVMRCFHMMCLLLRCKLCGMDFEQTFIFFKSFSRVVLMPSWLMSSSVSTIFNVSRRPKVVELFQSCRCFWYSLDSHSSCRWKWPPYLHETRKTQVQEVVSTPYTFFKHLECLWQFFPVWSKM